MVRIIPHKISIRGGKVERGVEVNPSIETPKRFAAVFSDETSLFPWVKPPLEPGGLARIVDQSTGLETPYLIPAGHDLEVSFIMISINQEARCRCYIDGQLVVEDVFEPGHTEAYTVYGPRISNIDPNLVNNHTIDFTIKNLGDYYLYGSFGLFAKEIVVR